MNLKTVTHAQAIRKRRTFKKRMNRLDVLRVLTELYEYGTGREIYKKAIRAYNKEENFTGIIRLNSIEKDFLSYCLESDMTEKEIETTKFYLK